MCVKLFNYLHSSPFLCFRVLLKRLLRDVLLFLQLTHRKLNLLQLSVTDGAESDLTGPIPSPLHSRGF